MITAFSIVCGSFVQTLTVSGRKKRPTAWDEFFSLRNEAKVW